MNDGLFKLRLRQRPQDDMGEYHSLVAQFNDAGTTTSLRNIGQLSSLFQRNWAALADTGWCGQKLTSSLEQASIWDLLFLFGLVQESQRSISMVGCGQCNVS